MPSQKLRPVQKSAPGLFLKGSSVQSSITFFLFDLLDLLDLLDVDIIVG